MLSDPEQSILVYDIGGSHVSSATCTVRGLQLGPVVSELYPDEQSSSAFLEMLERLGRAAANGNSFPCGAELAFPGPFDFLGGISLMQHKLPYLYGLDLRAHLAELFGWAPVKVRFVLDSQAFLLGEIAVGAARGFGRAVGITLGTGVGSAFAIHQRVVTDGEGVPPGGEIWNLPFHGGIVEDAVSSRAIRKACSKTIGAEKDVSELAGAAEQNSGIRQAFQDFGHNLGLALRTSLADFAPQVVVLGGGICRSPHLFLPAVQQEVKNLKMEIRISQLFDRAALVGAAVAWFNSSNDIDGEKTS